MRVKMLSLSYDLHLHSCLSPCGDDDMTPSNIVGMAVIKGLDVIALTDHNSCKNCEAALEVAKAYGITLICGMELTTEEEVHVVCLFPNLEKAMEWDTFVYSKLVRIPNDTKIFGKQQVYDGDDNIVAEEPFLLINATTISFEVVFDLVKKYDGIAFPAHIDKNANSLFSNLGFIPPNSTFKCVEIKDKDKFSALSQSNEYLKSCKAISNSDAHYLVNINEPINFLHSQSKEIKDILLSLSNTTQK